MSTYYLHQVVCGGPSKVGVAYTFLENGTPRGGPGANWLRLRNAARECENQKYSYQFEFKYRNISKFVGIHYFNNWFPFISFSLCNILAIHY